MPVDIPQLEEAIERIEWDCPGDVHVAGMSWDDRELVEAALRAVVEATTIQWCTTHGERASMQWPDSNWQCHFQGVCRVEPMLLVDPGSQP